MKAALIRKQVVPPKTHDLVKLDALLRRAFADWSANEDELRDLSRGSVLFRYPGAGADQVESAKALRICRSLRKRLLPLV
jgi:HEPN domain-containing protein